VGEGPAEEACLIRCAWRSSWRARCSRNRARGPSSTCKPRFRLAACG